MNAMLRTALFTVGASAMMGCAATGLTDEAPRSATSDDCLFARALRDWRPLDDRNLLLFGTGRQAYHVELFGPAPGLRFDVMIGVYDRDGMICPYGGDAIVIRGPMPERVPIRSIKRLSEDELDAVYVRFGIRAPAVIEATEVEPEEADSSQ